MTAAQADSLMEEISRVHGRALRRKEGDRFDEFLCIRQPGKNTWITCDSGPDWFLFPEEDQLRSLPGFDRHREAKEEN